MKLTSDDGLGRLEMDVFDLELRADPPRLALFTRARVHSYTGEHKAWVALPVLRRFAQELEALLGQVVDHPAAVLDGIDAEAFQLTVLPGEDELNAIVHLSLKSTHRLGARDYPTSLNGAITLPVSDVRLFAKTMKRWTDPKFLEELETWGFDEKALLDE